MEFLTKEQILDDLIKNIDDSDRVYLLSISEDELSILHHGYGTFIRNHFHLWDVRNPLTYDWFYDCAGAPNGMHKYIVDGVDCHPHHPDQVSFDIIKELHKRVQNDRQEVQTQ